MGPRHTRRECGDNGGSDLQRPIGADDLQRLSEGTRLGVPRTGSSVVGFGGAGQQTDEVRERDGSDGFVAGGGVHERSIPYRWAIV